MFREGLKDFQSKNTTDKLNSISFIFFCIVAMDCALTGGGHWLMIGPFSFRMILGLLAAGAAAPSMIRSISRWHKDPILISLLLFIIYLAVCAIVGLKKGNPAGLLLSDIKGFAWLFLVPVAMAVVNNQQRMIVLMRCLAAAAVIQALIIFTFNALFVLDSRIYDLFYRAWMHMQLATVDQISATTYRFFFNSAPYMVIGILCLTYLQLYAHRFRWFYAVGMGLCLAALMLTFTRSIYGAAAISLAIVLVFALVYCARRRKRLAGQIAVAMAAFALLVVFQQVALGCNTAQFAIARTFNLKIPAGQNDGRANEESNEEAHDFIQPDEQHMRESYDVQANNEIIPGTDSVQVFEEINLGTDYSAVKNEEIPGEVSLRQQQYIIDTKHSDQIRENTLQELNEMICRSPVFGNGLGAAVACREGGYVEYFYQDIVNKTGFFGLLLYYFPIGYMVFSIARKWKSSDADRKLIDITWICGMTVFLAATYFNPYMNSSLGICCLSIAIACFRLGHSRQIRFKAA